MPGFLRFIVCLALCWGGCSIAYCQDSSRAMNALMAVGTIKIDGKLDEAAWQNAEKVSGFIQNAPNPGDPSRQKTEVSILYDNDAIYIGAILYDASPDSIYKQLSSRDDDGGNVDEFIVGFDTYYDKQNVTYFGVTAAGVQVDGIIKFDAANSSWNAAWYSKVSFNGKGWCVEMKIPYSALRFPKKAEQVWGVNFYRSIRRYREKSYWSKVLPNVANGVSQEGVLNGIKDIQSPIRLSLAPYVSAYGENYNGSNAHSLDGGMDIKYGFNESFTLDMTLIPDFGQTIFDNKVLNLSPVEVKYDERRYFFTEGLDLFNKNNLFYSRRVGGSPINSGQVYNQLGANEIVTGNPSATKLLNATKISGRTSGNLGVGFFNAVSAPEYADVRDTIRGKTRQFETSPLTNYNVLVLDQAYKNNSYLSLINTNVARKDNSYNADVTALLFKIANKKNTYGIDGSTDVSQLYYTSKPDVGYRYLLDLAKLSGNYTWKLKAQSISDHFNPNDLGYLGRNNISYYSFEQYYNIFKPIGQIVGAYNHVGINYYRVFNPDVFQSADIYGSHNITLKNYLTLGAYWDITPVDGNDYYEPRTAGRYYVSPKNTMFGGFYSSDYRKKFALDVSGSYKIFGGQNRNTLTWEVSPRFIFNDKLSLIYTLTGLNYHNDVGFVASQNDSIYFGVRNVATVTNALDMAYIFNNTMSLKVSARHYWSQATYHVYDYLNINGSLSPSNYTTNSDVNFNSFNVFMSYIWQFKPGSEMSVVYQNSIYRSGSNIVSNYFDDVNYTFRSPISNCLSVKIIYYLDYIAFRNLVRGQGRANG